MWRASRPRSRRKGPIVAENVACGCPPSAGLFEMGGCVEANWCIGGGKLRPVFDKRRRVLVCRASRLTPIPAAAYLHAKADLDINVIAAVKEMAERVSVAPLSLSSLSLPSLSLSSHIPSCGFRLFPFVCSFLYRCRLCVALATPAHPFVSLNARLLT